MSSDTDRLEKEAESHRSSLDSTLDAIRDRLSVGQIVDEFTGYLKEGQGADAMKNLGRQVRDNPLALGLVGAGLTWLFMGSGARAEHSERRHEVPRPQGSGASRGFSQSSPRTSAGPAPAAFPGSSAQTGPRTPPRSGSTAQHSGTADHLSRAADSAKGAASGAKETMTDAAHAASDKAGRMWDSASAGMHDAADAGHSAAEGARQMGHDAYRAGARAQRNIADLLEREPLVFGAVAFAIGAAAGAMLPATRTEDEWMGEMRDEVRDDVYAQGEDLVDSVKNVAAESYDAASRTAEDKGLKPGPGSSTSETLAEKVSDVAQAATDTAKDKAKDEGLR